MCIRDSFIGNVLFSHAVCFGAGIRVLRVMSLVHKYLINSVHKSLSFSAFVPVYAERDGTVSLLTGKGHRLYAKEEDIERCPPLTIKRDGAHWPRRALFPHNCSECPPARSGVSQMCIRDRTGSGRADCSVDRGAVRHRDHPADQSGDPPPGIRRCVRGGLGGRYGREMCIRDR